MDRGGAPRKSALTMHNVLDSMMHPRVMISPSAILISLAQNGFLDQIGVAGLRNLVVIAKILFFGKRHDRPLNEIYHSLVVWPHTHNSHLHFPHVVIMIVVVATDDQQHDMIIHAILLSLLSSPLAPVFVLIFVLSSFVCCVDCHFGT